MRQLKLIQDWGYNYIYVQHPNGTNRIDLKDHSYKDVVNTPLRDMVSTIAHEDLVPSWLVNGCPLWLSGAINKSDGEINASSLNYVVKPNKKLNHMDGMTFLQHLMCVPMYMAPSISMLRVMTLFP